MTTPTPIGEARVFDLTAMADQSMNAQELALLQSAIETDRKARALLVAEPSAVLQPRTLLSSGHSIPLVGLGTWKAAKGEVHDAVQHAIKAGYRHIDCAAIYENEHEVGDSLTAVFKQGIVKREDLYITSKLWNTQHAPENVEVACKKTLADLQLTYLDEYLIHWPSSLPGPTIRPPIIDTWRAMEALVDKGLVRTIGVSNFSILKLQDLLAQARIKPAVNQVEAHPYWRNDQLLTWCQGHGIHMTAYSPLGSPDSAAMFKRGADVRSPMKDPVIGQIAEQLGKSPAQIMIRWGIQRGTSVLPKSVHPERIAANLDVTSWSIPEESMKLINDIKYQMRMVPGTFLVSPTGPYKTLEDLWDEPTPSSL